MEQKQFIELCNEYGIQPEMSGSRESLMTKLRQEGRAKQTGRFFIKSSWQIDEKKLRTELGKLGIKIEPEYTIDLSVPRPSKFRSSVREQVKKVVEAAGGKFNEDIFEKNVKSSNLTSASEEYFK